MHTSATRLISVVLIDDHPIVRSGLRVLINNQPGMRVVGEAGDRANALAVAERERPDIILLDLDLGDVNGLDLLPELLAVAAEVRVIILTGTVDSQAHARALHLGAMGVVLKEHGLEALIKAIRKVYEGEMWLDRSMIADVFGQRLHAAAAAKRHDPEAAKIATLTKREREVVALAGEGLKNKQIADRLFISEGTVRNHLTSIFGKLEVTDRFELIMYAYRHGLAKPLL